MTGYGAGDVEGLGLLRVLLAEAVGDGVVDGDTLIDALAVNDGDVEGLGVRDGVGENDDDTEGERELEVDGVDD